jgi:pyruvate kinase
MGAATVPLLQKRIILRSLELGKPVITATQMLESMIHSAEPTRAEASDVANAVLDGTSALMLSGETAVGRYPLEAVAVMNRIARVVEPSLTYHDPMLRRDGEMASILSHAACDIAEELGAPVIAVPTQSGSTARHVSRFRPNRPIVATSPYPHVLQQLALDWAVVPIVIDDADTIEDLWHRVAESIRLSGLAEPGDRVVITGGTRLNLPGSTDHILVRTME